MVAVGWSIILCFAFAIAFLTAKRAFGDALLDLIAATLLVWLSILIFSLTLAGYIQLLAPLPAGLITLLVCVVILGLHRRIPTISSSPQYGSFGSNFQKIIVGGLVVAVAGIVLHFAALTLAWEQTQMGSDVPVFEMTTVVNFKVLHSLWMFDVPWSYYPFNYQLLFVPGMWITSDYALIPIVHLICATALLCFAALISLKVLRGYSLVTQCVVGLLMVGSILETTFVQQQLFVGKNDIFFAVTQLASIYYLSRYWEIPESNGYRYLVFTGLALGCMLGTKLSGGYWILAMGLVHGVLLIRLNGWRIWMWWKSALKQVLYIGLPIIALTSLWILRASLGYIFTVREAHWVDRGWGNTLFNLWRTPIMIRMTQAWLPLLAVILIGVALILLTPKQLRNKWYLSLAGMLCVVVVNAKILFANDFFTLGHGPLILFSGVAASLLIGYVRRHELVSRELAIIAGWVLISAISLWFTPFSAWTEGIDYVNPQSVYVAYRYHPAIVLLGIPMLLLLMTQIIHVDYLSRMKHASEAKVGEYVLNKKAVNLAAVVLMAVVLGLGILRVATYQPLAGFSVTSARFKESQLYSWVSSNLYDAWIAYPHGKVVPFFLHGKGLSNYLRYYNPLVGVVSANLQHIDYLIIDREFKEDYERFTDCKIAFQDSAFVLIKLDETCETSSSGG
jgi:hypothetical protein